MKTQSFRGPAVGLAGLSALFALSCSPANAAPVELTFINETTYAPLFDVELISVYENQVVSTSEGQSVFTFEMSPQDYIFDSVFGATYSIDINPMRAVQNQGGSFTVVFKSVAGEACDFNVELTGDEILNGDGPNSPVPVAKIRCFSTQNYVDGTWPEAKNPAPPPPGAPKSPAGSVVGNVSWPADSHDAPDASLGTGTKKDAISDILAQIGVNPLDLCIANPVCRNGKVCFPDGLHFNTSTNIPGQSGNTTLTFDTPKEDIPGVPGKQKKKYKLTYVDARGLTSENWVPLPMPHIQVKATSCSCQP